MTLPKVYLVFEHGPDLRPFGSAHIRLLRPLTHPTLHNSMHVTARWDYAGEPADAVIVDRLWRADISLTLAQELVARIRKAGARFVYTLDDDFLSLYAGGSRSQVERAAVVEYFLREADHLVVTTEPLRVRFGPYNENCVVIPNGLDERLLVRRAPRPVETPFGRRRLVIGYMGTHTHSADLALVLPAWKAVHAQLGDAVEFQLVGAVDRMLPAWVQDLPLRFVRPRAEEVEYPLFMLWFTSRLQWDIAVAPLADTPFNRCKSDIKFLDYCALGAAGVYSQIVPYSASVRHDETGCLVGDDVSGWADALVNLCTDDQRRVQLAQNGVDYLYTHRTLARQAHRWTEALAHILG